MFQKVLLAGSGGFLGTTARYALGALIQRWLPDTFPYATFVINVTGCLVIGFLGVLAQERLSLGADGRVFWMTGVLGGYTTFSTFGYETTLLLRAAAAPSHTASSPSATWPITLTAAPTVLPARRSSAVS